MGYGIYFKIAWHADLDMLNMFAVIYLPCNFEVNFIIYFAVITLFSACRS
jgi:hypothetical protein